MISMERRRAAIAAYKERKAAVGVYAVRCAPAEAIWVGQTRDLDKVWNRLSFSLRTGADPRPDLQAAWNAHGEAGFAFERLETLKDESLDFALRSALDERTAFWRENSARPACRRGRRPRLTRSPIASTGRPYFAGAWPSTRGKSGSTQAHCRAPIGASAAIS